MTISSTAFSHKKIKSIQFGSDSKLETIDEKAFGRILRASRFHAKSLELKKIHFLIVNDRE